MSSLQDQLLKAGLVDEKKLARANQQKTKQARKQRGKKGYVWVEGRWNWDNGNWAWVDGHWERQRRGQRYKQGRWQRRGDRFDHGQCGQ